jgi:predicted DNA-binding protein
MKSVRLDPALEAKLKAAAQMEGVSESALIRQAIEQRCDAILSNRADIRLADVIGKVNLGGGVAERAGEAFTELLLEREAASALAEAAQGSGRR